jgi:hypothetical protein
MITAGKRAEFILLVMLTGILVYTINKARGGKLPYIRLLPCVEALDEAVGRAAEMGRPLHFATGYGGLHDEWATMCIAALDILSEVSRLCGQYGVDIRYTCFRGYLVAVAQDIVRTGFIDGGHPEMYHDDMVHYTGEDQTSYVADMMSYVMRERPAVNMMFGATLYETQQTLGTGARVGAFTLGGTPRLYYQAMLLLICDYSLIGSELYAAGAYLSRDPAQMGVIQGQDWTQLLVAALIIIGVITFSLGGYDLIGQLIAW